MNDSCVVVYADQYNMPYDCQHNVASIDMEDSIIIGRFKSLHLERNHFLLVTLIVVVDEVRSGEAYQSINNRCPESKPRRMKALNRRIEKE